MNRGQRSAWRWRWMLGLALSLLASCASQKFGARTVKVELTTAEQARLGEEAAPGLAATPFVLGRDAWIDLDGDARLAAILEARAQGGDGEPGLSSLLADLVEYRVKGEKTPTTVWLSPWLHVFFARRGSEVAAKEFDASRTGVVEIEFQ